MVRDLIKLSILNVGVMGLTLSFKIASLETDAELGFLA